MLTVSVVEFQALATEHIIVAPSTLETIGRLYLGLENNTAML